MKVDLCDCIVYALYMVDSYLSSQGDGGDLYVYCVWFKVNVMFIYIIRKNLFYDIMLHPMQTLSHRDRIQNRPCCQQHIWHKRCSD